MRRCVQTSTWYRLGLAGNGNSIIDWEDVLGDNLWSDLAKGESEGGGGSITEGLVLRIASCVSGLHPGGATFGSGRKWPSVFYLYCYYYDY